MKILLTVNFILLKRVGMACEPSSGGGRLDSSSVLYGLGCPGVQTHPGTVYRFGPFEVNAASGELLKNGRPVRLQEQPLRLLVVLLETPGEVVSREELRIRLWTGDTFVDFDGSLKVAVRK